MTTEMITEVTTEMTTEMTIEKKITGISKTRDIRESIEIIMKTHMKTGTTRIIIELATKTKIGINIETSTEMTAMTKIDVGLERTHAYITLEKTIVLKVMIQNLNDSTKS